jgi:hypothetical protein
MCSIIMGFCEIATSFDEDAKSIKKKPLFYPKFLK